MDKKSLIGFGLIAVVLVAWTFLMRPSKEQREKQRIETQRRNDSLAQIEREQKAADSLAQIKPTENPQQQLSSGTPTDTMFATLPDSVRNAKLDSLRDTEAAGTFGAFKNHGYGEEKFTVVETDNYYLTFLNKGAQLYSIKLKNFHTYDKRFVEKTTDTLDLLIGSESGYNLTLFCGGKEINTQDLYFEVKAPQGPITGENSGTVEMRAYANGNPQQYLAFVYTIKGNSYLSDFNLQFVGLDKVIDGNAPAAPFSWTVTAPKQEKVVGTERERSKVVYKTKSGKVKSVSGSKKKKRVEYINWISFKQQFFSMALISKEGFQHPMDLEIDKYSGEETKRNSKFTAGLSIPYAYGPNESFPMQMYLGPNHYKTLKRQDLGLEDQVDLGPFFLIKWINKLVIFVFNSFEKMNLGYGLIILLLTIIIKLITSPVTYRTFVSSAKMRLLKPDIDELSKKYKPGEELQKQQAVMQLYKRAGVSPLAGCIPALLQMPILLAMFSFFPAAVELRQEGFLWAEDFSTYDSIISWNTKIMIFGWNFMNGHISLFTILMTITTLIYTWMSSGQMSAGSGVQARQMKIMMYVMPIVFLGVLNSYSSALSYYYFLSNLISILLMLVIRKFFIDEKKLHAMLEENKKRPVKKSKWAARLEEMQKLREQQMRDQRQGGSKGGNKGNPKGKNQTPKKK